MCVCVCVCVTNRAPLDDVSVGFVLGTQIKWLACECVMQESAVMDGVKIVLCVRNKKRLSCSRRRTLRVYLQSI